MSFLDSLVDIGGKIWDFATETEIGKGLTQTIISGFALNQVSKSIEKENKKTEVTETKQTDFGVREQVDPDVDSVVPVVYGTAFIGGNITDAVLSDDNKTMYYCLTLCEKTGDLLSTGAPSRITIERVYWNTNEIVFNSDGVTAKQLKSDDGVTDDKINGLVKIYLFNDGSNSPTGPAGYTGNTQPAQNFMPGWTSTHLMSGLVFAIIEVTYDRDKGITGLGRMEFKVKNTMTMAGDCLYDYMTNARYGAGLDPAEINA